MKVRDKETRRPARALQLHDGKHRSLPANDRLPYIRGRTMFAPYILCPGSLCNAGLWRCSLCGGVRAPRPTSSGTAVQCSGYGNVPGASRTPPPTVAGERMLALRTAMPLLRDRKHRSGVGAAYMPPAPSRKRPFTVHTRANHVRPLHPLPRFVV